MQCILQACIFALRLNFEVVARFITIKRHGGGLRSLSKTVTVCLMQMIYVVDKNVVMQGKIMIHDTAVEAES